MDELEDQPSAGEAAEVAGAAAVPLAPAGDRRVEARPDHHRMQELQGQEQEQQQRGPHPAASGESLQQAPQQLAVPTPGARNYGYADEFMMFCFKVEVCSRTDKHPRGSCPYAHPGDVARRRHPSRYQALLCPEVRAKKVCPRMDECQCSHSAFEFWLHPDRYRTSMCEKGVRCSRPVCFFAHTADELRPLPAGLKPAIPEEAGGAAAAGSSGGSSSASSKRASSSSSSRAAAQPFALQGPPGGLPASGGALRYLQHQQLQQHMLMQPGVALMPPGGGGYPPMGFVPVLHGADQYGPQPGLRYFSAADAPHAAGGAPAVVPGGAPAGPYVLHGGGQPLPHAPAQLPGDVVQSFAQLAVGPPGTGAATSGGGYEPGAPAAASGEQWGPGVPPQVVMLMQPGASAPQLQQAPYAPQLLYMPGPMEPSGPWAQQQQHGQGSGTGGYGPHSSAYGPYGPAPPAQSVAPGPAHAGGGPRSTDDGRGAPGLAVLAPGPPASLSIGSTAAPAAAGGAIGVPPMLQPGSRPL